jgi:hypothetical protein
MRSFLLNAIAILLLATNGLSQNARGRQQSLSEKAPTSAIIEVALVNAPGINDESSKLEIAYQLRITNESTFYEALNQGKFKPGSEERVGELVREASVVKKPLRSLKNREVVFRIPLRPEIRERLRNQPKDRINLRAASANSENIRLSREQEKSAQVFLFYSTLNVYDASLKRNIIIPVWRTWMFNNYPEARFEIIIEISSDGGYRVTTPLPTKARSK